MSLWTTASSTDILDLPAAARRSAKALRRGWWRGAGWAAMERTGRGWRLPLVPTGGGGGRQVPGWRARGVTASQAAAAGGLGRWRGTAGPVGTEGNRHLRRVLF